MTEQIGEAILGILLPQSSTAYNVLLYFIVVALSEEGFKYLLLKKRTWYSGEFNCQFDGIVYAVFVALGFALWENISYVLMYGLGTAAVRAVTAVPGHACFGVFMGAFYGLAKRNANIGDEYRSSRCSAQREVIVNYIVTAFLQLTRQKELPESVAAVTTEQNNLIETIAVNLFTHIVQKLYH